MPIAVQPMTRAQRRSIGLGLSPTPLVDPSSYDFSAMFPLPPPLPTFNAPAFPTFNAPAVSTPQPVMDNSILGTVSGIINNTAGLLTNYYQAQAAINTAQANAANAGMIANAGAAAQIGRTLGQTATLSASATPSSLMPMALVGLGLVAVLAMSGGEHRR